jgi:S1-C subfamily serine protease
MGEMSPRRRRVVLPLLLAVSLVTLACGACPLATSLQPSDIAELQNLATRVVEQMAEPTSLPITRVPQPTAEPIGRDAAPTATPASSLEIVIAPGTDVETEILNAVYRKVNPSVVSILTDIGQGSGFVWDAQGHIVTNAHVVDGASELYVSFYDGTQVPASLVGEDPDSDLAVVKVDPELHTMVPVEVGDVDDVEVGDRAIAIGNPFQHQNTLTQGIISAKGRSISGLTNYDIPEALQTDAAINPGNSGGPLLDSQGRVIGINAQIDTGSAYVAINAGIGFAIPVNAAKRIVPSLIENGRYDHPYLGLTGLRYSPVIWEALGLDPAQRGAYVTAVTAGGPSARAGIRAGSRDIGEFVPGSQQAEPLYAGGDLIIAIQGQPVRDFDDLLIYLFRSGSPGEVVELTVMRDGREVVVPVTLGTRPRQ